ncbi:MAG: DUF370 domain-containing protein [Oscillospiraceae bacterium]|nr:DUF370 domain-containing protein [Oscillospiraceae bacterium]
MKLIDIGYGNALNIERIVAVVAADSAPTKRLCAAAKEKLLLIDSTCGKKMQSAFIMDSGHIVLSARSVDKFVEENKNHG